MIKYLFLYAPIRIFRYSMFGVASKLFNNMNVQHEYSTNRGVFLISTHLNCENCFDSKLLLEKWSTSRRPVGRTSRGRR